MFSLGQKVLVAGQEAIVLLVQYRDVLIHMSDKTVKWVDITLVNAKEKAA